MSKKIKRHVNSISLILFVSIITITSVFISKRNFDFIICGIAGLWVFVFFFCFLKFKERILLFWMYITIGVFLIARPFLETLSGIKWWEVGWLQEEAVFIAFIIVALSLVSITIGAMATSFIVKKRGLEIERADSKRKSRTFQDCLQVVAMVMFYCTAVFALIEGLEKVLFVQSHSYLEYYSSFKSHLPWFVSTIASMMKYSMCIFLATFPRKRRAFFVLGIFEITGILDLLVGVRGTIILNSIFILIYYLIRDFMRDREKWFGKIEKCAVAIVTPLALAFMTAYSFIRAGMRVLDINPLRMIKDFFIGQGVTFEVVARGIAAINELPQRIGRNYTFGPFIDYIVHGRIGQVLWGTEALPTENSVVNGTLSNSLAHNLSYITKGEDYLKGEGWGSSFVLENYIDFGYIGVILFSIVLGAMLILVMYLLGKRMLSDTIIFVSLLNIFYIPRAEATGWAMFLVTLQFWVCVAACYLGAYISVKVSLLQNVYQKLKLLPVHDLTIKKRKFTLSLKNKKTKTIFISVLAVILCGIGGLAYYKYHEMQNRLNGTIECTAETPGAEYVDRRVGITVHMEEKGKYQYQFSETVDGKERVVQEYSADNEYSFIAEEVGEYVFYIDVKDEEGNKGVFTYFLEIKEKP